MTRGGPANLTLITTAATAVVLALVCLFPFAWMALSSVKTLPELFTVPPHRLPDAPTWANYATALLFLCFQRLFVGEPTAGATKG